MEFPFGHHTHHHHRRNDDDDEENRRVHYPPPDADYPPPPPPPPPYIRPNEFASSPPPRPYYQETEYPPPPPPPRPHYEEYNYAPPPPAIQEAHVYHTSHNQELGSSFDYPPPPPQTEVIHVSHEQTEAQTHHFRPHVPSFLHSHTHHSGFDLSGRPTYKVYCKADPNFLLTIRDGKVTLASFDPSDDFQKWYKDEKYSTKVKDEAGFPCFALVNKATGQAMKHSIGDTHPVQLIPYNPDFLDESVLWTESQDLGDGYRAVRMVNNIRLNLDAFHGDRRSGGVHDGTVVVLWQWNKGDNQRWKITPYFKRIEFLTNSISESALMGA